MEYVSCIKVISVDEFKKMVEEGKVKVTDVKICGGGRNGEVD